MALRIFAHDHNGNYSDYIFKCLAEQEKICVNQGNLGNFKEMFPGCQNDTHLAFVHADRESGWREIANNNESVYIIFISDAYKDYDACNAQREGGANIRCRKIDRSAGENQRQAIEKFISHLVEILEKNIPHPQLNLDLLNPRVAPIPDELLAGCLLLLANIALTNDLNDYFTEKFEDEDFGRCDNKKKLEILKSKLAESYKR